MAKAVYSEDGSMKLCRGMLHREGVMVPLHKYHIIKAGRLAGKPMYECADCWRYRQGNKQSVSMDVMWPVINRLKSYLGTDMAICDRMGVHRATISRMRHQERMNGEYVQRFIDLDHEIAREQKIYRNKTGGPEVIRAEPLGTILRKFCKDWFSVRPTGVNTILMGPQDWLSTKTEISVRQIARFCNSENQFVSLVHADKIFTALGMQGWTEYDEIEIIPNPMWSLESYVAYMKERGCV